MYQWLREIAERHNIPYRGLPDIDPDRRYTTEDIPKLIGYLDSDYFLNRELAARQLSYLVNRHRSQRRGTEQLRQQLEPAVPQLEDLLEDSSPAVTDAAEAALKEMSTLFPERCSDSDVDDL